MTVTPQGHPARHGQARLQPGVSIPLRSWLLALDRSTMSDHPSMSRHQKESKDSIPVDWRQTHERHLKGEGCSAPRTSSVGWAPFQQVKSGPGLDGHWDGARSPWWRGRVCGEWREEKQRWGMKWERQVQFRWVGPQCRDQGLWLRRPISKRPPPRRGMPSSSCLRIQGRMSSMPHSAVILCPATPWEQKSSDKGLLLTSVTSEIFKSQTWGLNITVTFWCFQKGCLSIKSFLIH